MQRAPPVEQSTTNLCVLVNNFNLMVGCVSLQANHQSDMSASLVTSNACLPSQILRLSSGQDDVNEWI